MPGHHTAKEKRQARHVADSMRARGHSAKEAESIGWATVNKHKSEETEKCEEESMSIDMKKVQTSRLYEAAKALQERLFGDIEHALGQLQKGGPGSRGGRVSYYTKSGKPVYRSKVLRFAPDASKMAENWTHNASRSGKHEDHATAAKQHLAAAFYQHHAGDEMAAKNHLAASAKHREQAGDKGGRAAAWYDKNHKTTRELVHGKGQKHDTKKSEQPIKEGAMSDNKNPFGEIFKSELAQQPEMEKGFIDCTNCGHELSKADIIKARRKKVGHASDADTYVADQNDPNAQRGGGSHGHPNGQTPVRGTPGAQRIDPGADHLRAQKSDGDQPAGQQVQKGGEQPPNPNVPQQVQAGAGFFGNSPWVQWANTGEDQRIAKSIEEQQLGEGMQHVIPINRQ